MLTYTTIDEYISSFSKEIQELLFQMRKTIQKAAPEATESIKYGMPTFELKGNLVHFSANKNHVGFYPAPSGLLAFKKEISNYTHSKGAVQFPYTKTLPLELVAKITQFRVTENLEKALIKKNTRVCKMGHKYTKISDCPTCPVCEKDRKPKVQFLSLLSAPARRALESNAILTVEKLSHYSEKELLQLHGLGPSSLSILKKVLLENGLEFKN
jgi:uncharacterized protein YdhG (YjbR/CyaY superfamily)